MLLPVDGKMGSAANAAGMVADGAKGIRAVITYTATDRQDHAITFDAADWRAAWSRCKAEGWRMDGVMRRLIGEAADEDHGRLLADLDEAGLR